MKKLKRIAILVLTIVCWTLFVGYGFVNGFLLRPLTSNKNPVAFLNASKEKITNTTVGNLAMVVIENGKIAQSFYYSKGKPVDKNTVFPVASISKWVTAFGIMKLVEDGKLDLDQPIENYLTRWHLPKGNYDNNRVTARLLLSHSSGLVDDLGYTGFKDGEAIQTLEESLTKATDTDYSDGIAKIGLEPGTQYRYSGAGYTILQLVIEEISGKSFQEYMTKTVFEPLKMKHSTFIKSEKPNLQFAEIFKTDGTKRNMNTFTALAAASLYTSVDDLSKFMKANISKETVLSNESLNTMRKAHAFIGETGIYGLGPHLFSQQKINSIVIGHDGSGNDAINTSARIDVISKSGIIILQTGNYTIASTLADEWLFWKIGVADYIVMQRNKTFIITLYSVGLLLIIGVLLFSFKLKA